MLSEKADGKMAKYLTNRPTGHTFKPLKWGFVGETTNYGAWG